MRGIPSLITDIRKKVFTEVARMAYEDGGFSRVKTPSTGNPSSWSGPSPRSGSGWRWACPSARCRPGPS